MSDNFDIYCKKVNSIELLTEVESDDLWIKIRSGDKKAFNKMVESNLRLVIYVINPYVSVFIEKMDLIMMGNFGLITAVRKYDINKRSKFSTYAMWWIKHYVYRGIHERRLIRLPMYVTKFLMAEKKMKRTMTDEQIYDKLYELGEHMKWHEVHMDVLSIDSKLSNDYESMSLGDTLFFKDDDCENKNRKYVIRKAISTLNENEQVIIKMYYGFYDSGEVGFREVGKKIGLSGERIRQIIVKINVKLKKRCFDISRECGVVF